MNQRLITATAVVVMAMAGIAYLMFLAFTWREMQKDRTASYAKVDALLDRLPVKPAGEAG